MGLIHCLGLRLQPARDVMGRAGPGGMERLQLVLMGRSESDNCNQSDSGSDRITFIRDPTRERLEREEIVERAAASAIRSDLCVFVCLCTKPRCPPQSIDHSQVASLALCLSVLGGKKGKQEEKQRERDTERRIEEKNTREERRREEKRRKMFRNQYDTDVTTWSPAGRLFQVEYAMEAVKQGSAAVGLRSSSHAVLAAVNKAASDLASHQRKLFRADRHVGVAIAGLTADGRVLSRFLRNECINHSFVYESPLPVARLVVQLADKAQVCTQRSWKRPYGVGLLVAGLDETGAHLYYNCPSGNYFEYQAFAIGSRSQAAKTFLERRFHAYDKYTREELIKDALFAIKETLQGEKLTSQLCTVAIVGQGEDFHIIDQNTIQEYIDAMETSTGAAEEEEAAAAPPSGDAPEGSSEPAPMDI